MSENDFFAALSHPHRRLIIRTLGISRGMPASRLADAVGVSRPGLSSHLKVLKSSRIVHGERRGKSIVYQLDSDTLHTHIAEMLEFLNIGAIDHLFAGSSAKRAS
ncbi:helix-turn-helix transcriptional regulator [Nocardiopsis sp. YSL2]|uniref:ArsR/SmtB family transcription factor n=1 Tax=Nocardiopsis sp. YSL2 TaxID=2939492 RepID=UPI0026F45305|nr:metalloregulator ArsR/SmtB family transcription factor [Nocardiopsis sp. YSL2]